MEAASWKVGSRITGLMAGLVEEREWEGESGGVAESLRVSFVETMIVSLLLEDGVSVEEVGVVVMYLIISLLLACHSLIRSR